MVVVVDDVVVEVVVAVDVVGGVVGGVIGVDSDAMVVVAAGTDDAESDGVPLLAADWVHPAVTSTSPAIQILVRTDMT